MDIYNVKFLLNKQIERMKAWLVAKHYTQTYSVNYCDIFSLVTRLHFIYSFYQLQW